MEKVIQIKRIQEDDSVFIDMADSDDNPCLSCGACCNHYRISFYHGEIANGSYGTVPGELTSKVNDHFACMKGTEYGNGRCIALQGTIGEKGISCSIYADRPSFCRTHHVWGEDGTPNPRCQQVRQKFGLPLLKQAQQ